MSKLLLSLSDSSLSSHDFTIEYPRHIQFQTENPTTKEPIGYEIALVSASCYYVNPNITSNNNQFKYYNGTTNRTLTIPFGLYNLQQLNDEIRRQMTTLSDQPLNINIVPNFSTNRVRIELIAPYTVDFTIANSVRDLLGFVSQVVTVTKEGENSADMANDFEKILIHCSLVQGSSYNNSIESDIIGEMLLDKSPGSQLSITPAVHIYIPLRQSVAKDIPRIRCYFTTQSGKAINFLGENTSVSLYIRASQYLF